MTESGDLCALLPVAIAAARAGAEVLSAFPAHRMRARDKGEQGNLVTEADLAAERAIRMTLGRLRPDDSVIGEEFASAPAGSGIRWVVDPLDGTTNFTRGIPFFCTSVAAQETASGRWLVGVVQAPALDRLYWACDGAGAWRGSPGAASRLSGPQRESSARLLGTGFSYDPAVRTSQYENLVTLMAGYTDLRRFGSAALGLCLAAEGSIDGFVEADLEEYDWAAGALIAAEAGLEVIRPDVAGGAIRATLPD